MRTEIKRIEETAQRIIDRKNDLISSGSYSTDFDPEGLETRMTKEVLDETNKAQGIDLQFPKDSNPTAATAKTVWNGGGVSHSSIIKREAVQLPKFSGDKMAGHAFLNILFGSKIGNLKFWNKRKYTKQVC